jgi:glycosyltransferase involved in cell wall biosynthesis
MKKELINIGIPENKVRVLPNGIDTNIFHPQGEKEEKQILFVGRVCREKGIDTLIKALTYLKTPTNLTIIGPKDWNPRHFSQILELIKKENEKGKHKIVYLGAKTREEIIKYYQKASMLVLPSQKEGFPMVILEALAYETPVITTNVNGILEILQNNECGLIIPPNNPQKLAEAIQFLLDNKETRIEFGQKGRETVEKRFSMDAVVEKLCKIYDEAVLKFGG